MLFFSSAQELFPNVNTSSSEHTSVDEKVQIILPGGSHGSESSLMKTSAEASLASYLPQQHAQPPAKIIPSDWQLVVTICLQPKQSSASSEQPASCISAAVVLAISDEVYDKLHPQCTPQGQL